MFLQARQDPESPCLLTDPLLPSHTAAPLGGGRNQPSPPNGLTSGCLHHSPVAPMEDLGTLKEQHREQKLFPQLLQLRCKEPRYQMCRPHPEPPSFPTADLTQGTWDYHGNREVPKWGRTEQTQPPMGRLKVWPEGQQIPAHLSKPQTPGPMRPSDSPLLPCISPQVPANTPSRKLTLFFSTEKVAEQPVQFPDKQRQQLSLEPAQGSQLSPAPGSSKWDQSGHQPRHHGWEQ